MAKLSPAELATLQAAGRGDLRASAGYDWRRNSDGTTRRCTRQAQSLVAAGLVRLAPWQRGDEHRGQQYELTAAGRAELAESPE